MYDIFIKETLYNAYEKETNQILSQIESNDKLIRKCIFHENANQYLIVFIVGKYDLIFHYVMTNGRTQQPQKHIKRFPTIREHGEIRDVCFDSSGDNIYVLFGEGFVVCLALLEEQQLVDLNANIICTQSICSPTHIIVWFSLDAQLEIAIVGNDIGELCFVNIETKQTSIRKAVKNLRIIRDKFTITLLITAVVNTQLKLPLEENRLSLILNQDNDADNIKFMEENRTKLFSCIINDGAFKDEDKINTSMEKMNIKPVQILNNKDFILINQQSFILATYYQDHGNLASINIYEGNEFTYEFTTPLSKYCFPKECVSLDYHIIELVTERLIITANSNQLYIISKQCSDFRREKSIDNNSTAIISSIEFNSKILSIFRLNENQIDAFLDTLIVVTNQCAYKLKPKMSCENIFIELIIINKYQAHEFAFMMRLNLNILYKRTTHHFLQNKQYQKVLELFASDNISKLELIKNCLLYGYLNESINIISHLFDEKNYDLDDQDKVSFANVYVACSIQRILEKRVLENEKNVSKLKKFLITNIYYNEQYVIKLLISSYMFSLAKLCARVRNNYACLIRNLLNVEQVLRELFNNGHDQTIYDKIVKQSMYSDVLLIEPFRCMDYFQCLLTGDILQGFFIESDLISTYLKLLIETLPKLDNKLLKRASRLLDPRQPQVQILLNNVVNNCSTKKYMYDDGEQQTVAIQKKDVINFFISVNLIILKNQNANDQFDERILFLNKNRPKETNGDLEYNASSFEQDYMVAAGQSRGFLIKQGNLFSWGSAKYGADAEVNITQGNCKKYEPKLNTYFSDLLAIKVIGVSSGAQHTLILTKISCYAVGQSIYGQLGCGKKIQYTRYPKTIRKLQNLTVQKLVCGQYHSFALTVDGRLYSWGWATFGQLGHGDTETLYEPKLIKYFKHKKVVDICTGYCHTIVLDSDGLVYSFGSNVYGQLGCGSKSSLKKRNLTEPIYLIDDKIDLISSKYFQCLAYSKRSKTIYYFGTSPQNNQLMAQQLKKMRHNQENLQQQPQQQKVIIPPQNNNEHHTPKKLKLDDLEIQKLQTGNLHCLLLTKDGRVYSWGRGPEGQMGHGGEKSVILPTLLSSLSTKKIVDIASGYDFSLCVDSEGNLYSWGQNIDHQLGFITKFEPNKALNGMNNLLENNKKLRFKSKKVLTMLSSKQVEKEPVKVEFKNESLKSKIAYMESMSIDFSVKNRENRELKEQQLSEVKLLDLKKIGKNRKAEQLNNLDICMIIYKLRHELDLRVILDTCLMMNSYLCCGFIYELLKEPLNALDFYMKAAYNSIEQTKEIFNYFINRTMTVNSAVFKQLMIRFANNWLDKHEIVELETLLIDMYEEKVNSFLFGLFLFQLMESELKAICFSNEFKIKLMKITCKYLQSAKFNEFNYEPASTLLSSISNNQNMVSAEKLWKKILGNIQKELDKKSNGKSISVDDQTQVDDCLENGIEIVPEDNQIYIFSCNHHFNSLSNDYYSSILLKQIEIINSDLKHTTSNNQIDFKANSSKCPLCL